MATAAEGIVVNIGDMIDLAIGTPEVGVVDFNMLQTVLHCLAQQLRILYKSVEIRGSMTSIPAVRENMQTIAISEYVVETGDKGPSEKTYKEIKDQTIPSSPENSILVVERIRKSESPQRAPRGAPSGGTKTPSEAQEGAGKEHVSRSKTAGASGAAGSERLSLVTVSKFNILEGQVQDLHKRVYGTIPKNEDILEEVRSQSNIKAITDMWTNMNVSSRLEAAERGISKLSSLVEDLITLNPDFQRRVSEVSVAPAILPPPGPATVTGAASSGTPGATTTADIAAGAMAPALQPGSPPKYEDILAIYEQLNRMQNDLDDLANTFYGTMDDVGISVKAVAAQTETEGRSESPAVPGQGGKPMGGRGVRAGTGGGSADQPGVVGEGATEGTEGAVARRTFKKIGASEGIDGASALELLNRLNELETRVKDCCDNVSANYGNLIDNINSVQDQMEILSKHVWSAEAESNKISPELLKDLQGLMQLFTTVQEMKAELANVHETAQNLAAEKESRHAHLNTIIEQIELLKVIKLDREDMAEALAEKADLNALARKVSHDRFEMACDDLSKGLEHAIAKLNMQESLWQQALDDLQREIATKLDKMELSPVKDYFYNKLKQLQENLKQIASMRRDIEAAGAKRKLLRDVNCISCDADAVMSMEPPKIAGLKPLPAHGSMKPYLTYELDAIRKTQAANANMPQRNMHDLEKTDKQMAQSNAPLQIRSDKGKHPCNRYCGGSHTVTTPAQRVTRHGHFIKQWGPEVLPLSSGLAAGDDGKMYKVTNLESANVGPGGAVDICTPRKESKKPELPPKSPPPRPIIISAECRCLDGDGPTQRLEQ